MGVFWKPHKEHPCADGVTRTVYIRGEVAPFVGWIATPDTYFSCAAFVRVRGARVRGFVGECGDVYAFHPLDSDAHKMAVL